MSITDFRKNFLKGSVFITIIFPIMLWGSFSLVLLITDWVPILSVTIRHRYILVFSLFIIFCFYGLVQYLILKKFFSKSITEKTKCKEVCNTLSNKQPQRNISKNSRLFFYILSILQDKGRFLDFISEDLSEYEDTQIGVVARLIHENCKKSMNNYFSLEHIVKEHEGETITLSDFNIRTIKFIGNINGGPPYSGTVKHRGWRVRCKNGKLPNFIAKLDKLNTIYPAQIEVL